jgi:hypothetical protein
MYNIKLIHSNIISLVSIKGYNSCRYFITFKYNKTKLAAVYCIKSKKEITDCFIYFKKHFERLDLGWIIKQLHDNNNKEYIAGRL